MHSSNGALPTELFKRLISQVKVQKRQLKIEQCQLVLKVMPAHYVLYVYLRTISVAIVVTSKNAFPYDNGCISALQ